MREKLLEQRIKRPLTKEVKKSIDKRLGQLKKDMSGLDEVEYFWNTQKNKLFVKTVYINWTVEFTKDKKVIVLADVPFLLLGFVKPYKDKAIAILKKEIKKLMT